MKNNYMKKILLIFILLFFYSCSNSNLKTWENTLEKNTETEVKTKTILALWDSLTAWYWVDFDLSYPSKLQSKLSENWYDYKVINAWISWDTSDWLRNRANLYLSQNPEIVIIVIWWNDWLRWLSLENLKQNIIYISDLYLDLWSKVILWGMDIPANLWTRYRNDFINLYKEISNERKEIYFMPYFLEWVWWVVRLNLNDRIHPNPDWYDIVVNNLYKFLEKNNILNK